MLVESPGWCSPNTACPSAAGSCPTAGQGHVHVTFGWNQGRAECSRGRAQSWCAPSRTPKELDCSQFSAGTQARWGSAASVWHRQSHHMPICIWWCLWRHTLASKCNRASKNAFWWYSVLARRTYLQNHVNKPSPTPNLPEPTAQEIQPQFCISCRTKYSTSHQVRKSALHYFQISTFKYSNYDTFKSYSYFKILLLCILNHFYCTCKS